MATYAKLFYIIGFVWAAISFILLIVSWRAASTRNIKIHRKLMLILTAGAWLFILSYLFRYLLPDQFSLKVPPHLVPWLALHGTIALIPLFGSSTLVWARLFGAEDRGIGSHFNRYHRSYGRFVVILWLFTHAGGMLNFWLFS